MPRTPPMNHYTEMIFSGDNTGTEDVTRLFEEEMAYAKTFGKALKLRPGTYYIDNAQLTDYCHLVADQGQATIVYDPDAPAITVDNTVASTVETTITGITTVLHNTDDYVSEITVNDASGFEALDWIGLYSDDTAEFGSGRMSGEGIQLIDVDLANNKLYCYGVLLRPGRLVTNPKVRKFDNTGTCIIRGVKIEARNQGGGTDTNGGYLDTSVVSREYAIRLYGVVGVHLEHIHGHKTWAGVIRAQGCPAGYLLNSKFTSLPNFDPGGGVTGLGYGINVYGMCPDFVVDGIYSEQCRHPVTTDGYSGGNTSIDWYWRGFPSRLTFRNILAKNCMGGIDTHEEAMVVLFENCRVQNGQRGNQGGSVESLGFQLRGERITMKNCSVYGGHRGIKIEVREHGAGNFYQIENCQFSELLDDVDQDFAIYIDEKATPTNKPTVNIVNCTFSDVGKCILTDDSANLNIVNPYVWKPRECFIDTDGTFIRVSNAVLHYENTGNSVDCIMMRNDAECHVNGIEIVKGGGSNRPSEVFKDQEGTGHIVSMKGFKEDRGGLTATNFIESGKEADFTVTDVDGTCKITLSKLPAAGEMSRQAFVTDENGGPVLCYDDGTNWRRVSDGGVAS